jgi:hypothetical protein
MNLRHVLRRERHATGSHRNFPSAARLGIAIPDEILAQADEVIEPRIRVAPACGSMKAPSGI